MSVAARANVEKFNARRLHVERQITDALVSFFRACQEWDRTRSASSLRSLGRAGSRVYNATAAAERLTRQALAAGCGVLTFGRDGSAEIVTWKKSPEGQQLGPE